MVRPLLVQWAALTIWVSAGAHLRRMLHWMAIEQWVMSVSCRVIVAWVWRQHHVRIATGIRIAMHVGDGRWLMTTSLIGLATTACAPVLVAGRRRWRSMMVHMRAGLAWVAHRVRWVTEVRVRRHLHVRLLVRPRHHSVNTVEMWCHGLAAVRCPMMCVHHSRVMAVHWRHHPVRRWVPTVVGRVIEVRMVRHVLVMMIAWRWRAWLVILIRRCH